MLQSLKNFRTYQTLVSKTLKHNQKLVLTTPSEDFITDIVKRREELKKRNDEIRDRMNKILEQSKKLLQK